MIIGEILDIVVVILLSLAIGIIIGSMLRR